MLQKSCIFPSAARKCGGCQWNWQPHPLGLLQKFIVSASTLEKIQLFQKRSAQPCKIQVLRCWQSAKDHCLSVFRLVIFYEGYDYMQYSEQRRQSVHRNQLTSLIRNENLIILVLDVQTGLTIRQEKPVPQNIISAHLFDIPQCGIYQNKKLAFYNLMTNK